ncbi:MAG: phage terminase large subunit [Gammaproteobacteria bacterium]|nr:phage terminase large subunit [Gammaproteobacteria bacterium]
MFTPPPYNPSPEAIEYHERLDEFKKANPMANVIAPQVGPQTEFCITSANICIYGGAGGGGKTYGSLICGLGTLQENPGFDVTMFRYTLADAKKSGSLVDETKGLYLGDPINASYHGSDYRFTFPNSSTVALAGMSMDKQLEAQKGGQYGGVIFDELTLFKKRMFFFIMTRLRTMTGAYAFLKATTNPQPEGWVKDLLEEAGYLDKETGFAIYEMSGVLRWFYMGEDDTLMWFDSRKEALQWWKENEPEQWQRYVNGVKWMKENPGKTITDALNAGIDCRTLKNPLSFTFIPSRLSDNALMMEADPDYEAKLENQPYEDKMAMLYGCWKNFGNTGEHFKESMCEKISMNEIPNDIIADWGVDLAYTAKTAQNDPDYTCAVLLGESKSTGKFYVLDSKFWRCSSVDLPDKIKEAYEEHMYNPNITLRGISIPQDPAAGKGNLGFLARELAGLPLHSSIEKGGEVSPTGRKVNAKVTRFLPFASQAKHGNVLLVKHDNLDQYINQLVSFPTGKNDDAVDATSRAFTRMINKVPKFSIRKYV